MATTKTPTDKSRIARIQRSATKAGQVFSKLRKPLLFNGSEIHYQLVDANNYLAAVYETLEDAETDFGL